MIRLLKFLFLFLILVSVSLKSVVQAQTYTLSGYVRDAASGEDLIGAVVAVPGTGKGAAANTYGYYSLTLPEGTYRVVCSYVGYVASVDTVQLKNDLKLDFKLRAELTELREAEITADGNSFEERLYNSQMSVENITIKEAREIPVLLGETDIIKTLQLKAGVQSGSEGSTGLVVRGGSSDQNLIILDEALVYNAAHLFGLFSIFNSDAIRDVKLYKGDFPARFGGRLSSVLDVKLKEGNNQKFSVAGGLGVIASRLMVEAPIVKDRASFMLAGRRTYADLITRQINKANADDPEFNPIPDYYFYDLNAKLNYKIDDKNRIFLSGYFGRDVFGFNDNDFDFDFDWGNITSTLRWNHVFGPKLFLNTSVIFSDYKYDIKNRFDIFTFEVGSSVRDVNFKADFDYVANNRHSLKFGVQYTFHDFEVGRLKAGSDDGSVSFGAGQDFTASEFGVYLSDEYEPNEKWLFDYGLRISGFLSESKFYAGLEPRASVRFRSGENVSLKASYARMNQYVHLVSNSGASLPTDVWYPSNNVVKPQTSNQVSTGINIRMLGGKFLLTNEVYFKWMRRQIDFRDGAQLFVNNNLDDEFVFGKGYAYGNEITLEKNEGRLTGWVSYTLSRSVRKFADINDGELFPSNNDRRHDISLVSVYKLSKRITLSAAWVYGSGQPVTLATGKFLFQDTEGSPPVVVPIYGDRNSFRYRPYHRLDFSFIWHFFPKRGESDLTVGVYNLYDRRNPYFIYYEEVPADINIPLPDIKAKQVSLFPILPSITWNFKF